MRKHQIDHKQLTLIFGKLAEHKHISFRRMTSVANGCLIRCDLDTAEECLAVIEKYFPKAPGVATLRVKVKHLLEVKEDQREFNRRMQEPSPTLEWFRSQSPNAPMHPEIERMVRIRDICLSFVNSHTLNIHRNIVRPREQLTILLQNNQSFSGLSKHEANRMWHYFTLAILAEKGIKKFAVFNLGDRLTCAVCVRIALKQLSVDTVLNKITKCVNTKNLLPIKRFPTLEDVDNMPHKEIIGTLMHNAWYLPPYCESCRCQIMPFFV